MNCLRGNKEWRLVKSARQNDDYSFGDSSLLWRHNDPDIRL